MPPFEEAVEKLEEIIDRMESGEVGLEECLVHYEQGTKLVKHCRAVLDKAQKKIVELKADDNGDLREADAAGDTEDDE